MILVAVFAIVLHPMVCAGDSTSTVDKRKALKGCHTMGAPASASALVRSSMKND